MPHLTLASALERLPRPADPERAALRRQRWRETGAAIDEPGLGAFVRGLEQSQDGQRLLDALFGNSPFLTECALADPGVLRRIVEDGPEAAVEAVARDLALCRGPSIETADLAARLRRAKRSIALATAIGDISGYWELERITGVLADFAEQALSAAASHLLRRLAASGAIEIEDQDDPEKGSGLVVLGMGKLGARELNYSSDIDLVVLYDPERVRSSAPDNLQSHFVRLTRSLVRLIEERTEDGYVFRTDLRLRPDPGSTPPALTTLAAEVYYESLGQNWERAAMIKARPVAGDRQAAEACFEWLTPFIWRKHLDFAAIQDIHSIKRQIFAQRGGASIGVAGHNVKLGRGGIREIEFFVQTQQLIWGGRIPALRVQTTLGALQALVNCNRIEPAVAEDMARAYRFLRTVEHRLQMIADEQTHTLPASDRDLHSFAVFMGYDGCEDFVNDLVGHLERVEEHYADLFEEAPSLGATGEIEGSLVFTGGESDPDTIRTLSSLGYANPQVVDAAVRGWHHGRYRAMRSTRARELLTELMPALLKALGKTATPDQALLRFDRFLERLPSGVQLFSMFHANPQLLDLVAEVIGEAPRLADHLSRKPSVLDSVLAGDFFEPLPPAEGLSRELGAALARTQSFEEVLDATRRWAHDRIFQVGVQTLHGLLVPRDMGSTLSRIADCALVHLLEGVQAEFARRHGLLPGGAMVVIAMGKLGSAEMTPASDLDLIFVYSYPEETEISSGPRSLPPSQYYARLSQRFINSVSAHTNEGPLFEVDMRLRPSGNAGPIASSLDAFIHYHDEQAWTWEHMALTRARIVAGPPDLRRRVEEIVAEILTRRRDEDRLVADVAAMRARIDREFATENIWDIKYLRGGLIDIEFIAQYLQLRHAHDEPRVLATNTRTAIERLRDHGRLSPEGSAGLIEALTLWQSLQGLLRLTIEGTVGPEHEAEMSPGLTEALCRAGGAVDFADLKAKIRATAKWVFEEFQRLIDEPARAAAHRLRPEDSGQQEEQS